MPKEEKYSCPACEAVHHYIPKNGLQKDQSDAHELLGLCKKCGEIGIFLTLEQRNKKKR